MAQQTQNPAAADSEAERAAPAGVQPSRPPPAVTDADEEFFADIEDVQAFEDDLRREAKAVELAGAAQADDEAADRPGEAPLAPPETAPSATDSPDAPISEGEAASTIGDSGPETEAAAQADAVTIAPAEQAAGETLDAVAIERGESPEETPRAPDMAAADEAETTPASETAADAGAPLLETGETEIPEIEAIVQGAAEAEPPPFGRREVPPVREERQEEEEFPVAAYDAQEDEPIEPPPQEPAPPAAAAPAFAQAPRRKRSAIGTIAFYLALLALAVAGAGVGAVKYKDKDERLRAVADYVESVVGDPGASLRAAREKLAGLIPVGEESAPAPAKPETPVDVEAVETPAAPAVVPPPAPPPRAVAEAPAPQAPALQAPAPAESVAKDEEFEALSKRVDELEAAVAGARAAAEEARTAAEKAAAANKPPEGGPDSQTMAFVEGRIDELAGEIKALRDKLDAPKSETRAAPEAPDVAAPKPSAQAESGRGATLVVVAEALQRELERGRPFAAEHAALTALGADPELLAALAPSAETGARTPAQLARDFVPLGRRLRSLETKPGAPIADQLLAGASKLIKVRPAGAPAAETASDVVGRIETALDHGDLDAAASAFALLPEQAKAEAKSFGDALERRRAAEKAADALLSGAIAALGQRRN